MKGKKRGKMGCQVGNKNNEERGTHFCFFSNITEVTLGIDMHQTQTIWEFKFGLMSLGLGLRLRLGIEFGFSIENNEIIYF